MARQNVIKLLHRFWVITHYSMMGNPPSPTVNLLIWLDAVLSRLSIKQNYFSKMQSRQFQHIT